MSGHTPGPWRQREYDQKYICTDEDIGADIARVLWIGDDKEANARLIARAWEIPELEAQRDELLELARKVAELDELSRTWAKRGGDPEDKMDEWSRRRTLEEEIRGSAAPLVAKAEGHT